LSTLEAESEVPVSLGSGTTIAHTDSSVAPKTTSGQHCSRAPDCITVFTSQILQRRYSADSNKWPQLTSEVLSLDYQRRCPAVGSRTIGLHSAERNVVQYAS